MDWTDDTHLGTHVRQRSFAVHDPDGRIVPGVLWSPATLPGSRPAVLLGHGGSGRAASLTPLRARLVTTLVAEDGFHVAAIDGPVHGRRRTDGGTDAAQTLADFRARWRLEDGGRAQMAQDWSLLVDALRCLPEIGHAPLGYLGTSMGLVYGLQLCARPETVTAAVLGAWSSDYPNSSGLLDEARQVRIPVLFLQKWDDEVMSRAGQHALFDALGTVDKRLHAYPGGHAAESEEQVEAVRQFLRLRLAATAPTAG